MPCLLRGHGTRFIVSWTCSLDFGYDLAVRWTVRLDSLMKLKYFVRLITRVKVIVIVGTGWRKSVGSIQTIQTKVFRMDTNLLPSEICM